MALLDRLAKLLAEVRGFFVSHNSERQRSVNREFLGSCLMNSPKTIAFQRSFAAKHPEFIQATARLQQIANDIFADTAGPALQEPQAMCRCLTQTVFNSFYAMSLLAEHGCGADALKIVRSMFETSVVLASFDHFPELIQDFIDFRWIKKMKSVKEAKGTHREAHISLELEQEIKQHYDLVLPRFADKNGKPLSSWYRGTFKDLCERLDKDSVKMPWAVTHYSNLYTISSGLMHGDIIGLESQVDTSGFNIEAPPSQQYISESLMSAHWALWWALASYASIARLPQTQQYGDLLMKNYEDVWGEGSRELEEAKKDFAAQTAPEPPSVP
jgi:hypothetical protein